MRKGVTQDLCVAARAGLVHPRARSFKCLVCTGIIIKRHFEDVLVLPIIQLEYRAVQQFARQSDKTAGLLALLPLASPILARRSALAQTARARMVRPPR